MGASPTEDLISGFAPAQPPTATATTVADAGFDFLSDLSGPPPGTKPASAAVGSSASVGGVADLLGGVSLGGEGGLLGGESVGGDLIGGGGSGLLDLEPQKAQMPRDLSSSNVGKCVCTVHLHFLNEHSNSYLILKQ